MNKYLIRLKSFTFRIIERWIKKSSFALDDTRSRIELERRSIAWEKQAYKNCAQLQSNYHLSKEQKAAIREFYAPYCKCGTVFHEFYYASTGIFDVKYIPDDIFYTIIDPFFNNWDEAKIVDNKTYYALYFPDVEQPETIASRCGGVWFDSLHNPIGVNEVVELCRKEEGVFVKEATESMGGHGVSFVEKDGPVEEIIRKMKGDTIIQKALRQHSVLSSLNASSVNTIRLLSLFINGEVRICSAILRMGIGDSKVDNASSGGITCGINHDGTLKEFAYSKKGEKYRTHPTSEIAFSGVTIPNYSEAVDLIRRLQLRLPHFKMISWDIAIREDGTPVLIEMNSYYGELDFHQLNNGPLFGEDTEEILSMVFGKRSK